MKNLLFTSTTILFAATVAVQVLLPIRLAGSAGRTIPMTCIMPAAVPVEGVKTNAVVFMQADSLYNVLNLNSKGLSKTAFRYAWKGYNTLLRKGKLTRKDVLTICDFSQSSRNKRLYLIDLDEQKLILQTYVAHGKNSGTEFAKSFSNAAESHKSSLGFYVTRSTYFGEHGLSLRIDGLEKGINDKAAARHIVVHGANYIGAQFLQYSKVNGRSFGCPAVPADHAPQLIENIKQGSCLFVYHPSKKYLETSRIIAN